MSEWKHCDECTDLKGCEAHGCGIKHKVELDDCDDDERNDCEETEK